MKNTKDLIKAILLVPVAITAPFVTLIALWLVSLGVVQISNQVERYHMRNEIFAYVQENYDSITVDNPGAVQYYEYTGWAFDDNGVTYGYFYSPYDEYTYSTRTYRNGYLMYGTPNSGKDWGYYEQICENWYYYEEHFG